MHIYNTNFYKNINSNINQETKKDTPQEDFFFLVNINFLLIGEGLFLLNIVPIILLNVNFSEIINFVVIIQETKIPCKSVSP